MAKNTSVALGDHLHGFVEQKIQEGRFGNASEVVRAGLRLLEERETRLEALRAAPESPIARFNAANALYKTEDFQNALVEYQQALELGDPQLQSLANYNLG